MKTVLVLMVAALCAAVGDTFLSYGMRNVRNVSLGSAGGVFSHLLVVVKYYHVTIGVVFMGCFFYLYLASLSWADLSYAKPITSLSFAFAAVFAHLFLREDVSWYRWLGTLLILVGVSFVSCDRRQVTPGARERPDPIGLELRE